MRRPGNETCQPLVIPGRYLERGFGAMVTDRVRQFLCGLHGHDALLHFGQGRISLQCASCGYETPGWDFQTAKEDPQPAESSQVVRMPLVDHRRVA
jgi:hypothetical protein